MKERFQIYLTKVSEQKALIEWNGSSKTPHFMFNSPPQNKKLKKMDNFLAHLTHYEQQTWDYIGKEPENKAFYEAHFESVLDLLEDLQNKYDKSQDLMPNEFKLTPLKDVFYIKPQWVKFNDALDFCVWSAKIGALILGIIGGVVGIALGFVVGAELFLLSAEILITIAAIGAALGFVVGAIVGAVLGALIGLCFYPFAAEGPTTNPYVLGKAFDCELVEAAYKELVQEMHKTKDEIIDLEFDNSFYKPNR